MPISAKNGTASWDGVTILDVTDITINFDPDLKIYASSSTAGQKSRRAGHEDREGSFVMKREDTVSMAMGDTGTLVLKSSVSNTIFSGTVIIGAIAESVPIESGDIVELTVAWGQKPA